MKTTIRSKEVTGLVLSMEKRLLHCVLINIVSLITTGRRPEMGTICYLSRSMVNVNIVGQEVLVESATRKRKIRRRKKKRRN